MSAEEQTTSDLTARLARQLAIPLLGARLLRRLGITDAEQGHNFLFPTLASLPNPWLLKGVEEGVKLVLAAQARKTPVLVFGDYDVDGVCATVILVTFLQTMNMDVDWYIPDRIAQGYGLSASAVQGICAKTTPPGLVITVDNGITAIDEIRQLRENGFSVLITDHHKPEKTLPEADAIINPHQPGCNFPFADLAGAGVAFFLIMALRSALVKNKQWSRAGAPNLKEYLDLVALGTVADAMPLRETNRVLTRAGLEILSDQKRPGLKALCCLTGITGPGSSVTGEDISFRLAPRINAAGRMGNASAAVKLLQARDMARATKAAALLEEVNNRRKSIQEEMTQEAIDQCEKIHEKQQNILVLFRENWHLGVVGIVAAKICERYQRPTLVLADDPHEDGQIKGSGRGTGACDLFAEIRQCADLLSGFGGHSQAIGLKLPKSNLQPLVDRLNRVTNSSSYHKNTGELCHNIIEIKRIDEVLNKDFMCFLHAMEPFGQNNPEPIFLYQGARALRPTLVKKRHLRFSLQWSEDRHCDVIAFYQGEKLSLLKNNNIDIRFRIRKNTYQGQERVQLVGENISASL